LRFLRLSVFASSLPRAPWSFPPLFPTHIALSFSHYPLSDNISLSFVALRPFSRTHTYFFYGLPPCSLFFFPSSSPPVPFFLYSFSSILSIAFLNPQLELRPPLFLGPALSSIFGSPSSLPAAVVLTQVFPRFVFWGLFLSPPPRLHLPRAPQFWSEYMAP